MFDRAPVGHTHRAADVHGGRFLPSHLPAVTKTAVVFAAGWDNYEATETTYNHCRWYKDGFGVVHLEGLLKRTGATIDPAASSGTILTLPVGARPNEVSVFPAVADNAFNRVRVNADGTLALDIAKVWTSGSSFAYLDGVTFKAV